MSSRSWSRVSAPAALVAAVCVAGCGTHASSTTTATTTAAAPATTTVTAASGGPGALQGEALSAAAGDIPDNQVFVRYTGARFSMKVPEGWARTGSASRATFRDKNNIARVVVQQGAAPTVASVAAELAQAGVHVTKAAHTTTIGAASFVAATYTSESAPNPVTGKRVTLTVDRYELGKGGKRATVDLGTPVGVDNVDAYRLMIESFGLR